MIQDVDNASLEGQYQSFASLMEQRLAELFVLAGQQGTRFRRATAVGSYTVQVSGWHGSPQELFDFSGRTKSVMHRVREQKLLDSLSDVVLVTQKDDESISSTVSLASILHDEYLIRCIF